MTTTRTPVETEAAKLVFDIGMNRAYQFAVDKALEIETTDEPRVDPAEQFTFWCEVRDLIGDWKAELAQMRAEGR